MFKKLFTLILVFTQLITGPYVGFTAYAENFNKLKTHLSTCEGYPDNISDVDCATRASILDMKDMGLAQKSLFKVGPKQEFDIHLWNYNNIEDFAKLMERFLKNSAQKLYFNKVLSNVLNEEISEQSKRNILKGLFSSSKKEEPSKEAPSFFEKCNSVLEKYIIGKTKYVNFLNSELVTDLFRNEMMKTTISIQNGEEGVQKYLKILEKVKKNTAKMEIYEDAIEQVFEKIQKGDWVGNDALLVKLNHDPTYYNAFTEFRKEGFEYNNETIASKFKDTLEDLSKIIKKLNNHHDEEL